MKWHDMVQSVIAEYDRAGAQAAASEVLRLSAANRFSSSQEAALSDAAIDEIRSREHSTTTPQEDR
jgi:hypothetical protein